jgi:ubiquinone/menaquinone biosynthesis C-methylase UbiE
MDTRLLCDRFPRTAKYNPDWLIASAGSGANTLWLTEWLADALDLQPGMRVLDLGCGRAVSSIFLRREFGVEVWAADLWISPSENIRRIRDAGVEDGVFPLRVEAHSLPFAAEFFDAIIGIDSFIYFGSENLYLYYLGRFVKPHGQIAIANVGLTHEIDGPPADHLRAWWKQDLGWCLHSADWWRRHWEKTNIVEIERADTMPDGWQRWLDWQRAVAPDNHTEINAVEADAGRLLGYIRVVGRRRSDVELHELPTSLPVDYKPAPLLRD